MKPERLTATDQILQAVRELGVAQDVSVGEVPLDRESRAVGLVVNLSVDGQDARREAAEFLALARARATAVLGVLRRSSTRYQRYCCQFLNTQGDSTRNMYIGNYSASFEVIGESSHIISLLEALR